MRLDLYRSLWGVTMPVERLFPTIKSSGYVGVEARIPSRDDRDHFLGLLRDHDLKLIGIVSTSGSSPREHVDSLSRQADEIREFGAIQITAQSGRDDWTLAESVEFFELATRREGSAAATIGHELHRGRVFFNPWVTRDVMDRVPDIRLCIDYSHWVCVAERLFDEADPITAPIFARCAAAAIHIHTRVGYEEGPQVPDPSAPEYAGHLEAHERWWKQVIDTQRAAGRTSLSFDPEYGPPNYLHTLPHTNAPVAELDRIIDWSAKRFRQVFGE